MTRETCSAADSWAGKRYDASLDTVGRGQTLQSGMRSIVKGAVARLHLLRKRSAESCTIVLGDQVLKGIRPRACLDGNICAGIRRHLGPVLSYGIHRAETGQKHFVPRKNV